MNTKSISKKQLTIQEEQWLNQLNTIIDESLHQTNFKVTALIKPMRTSRTELYQKIKRLTGQTPHQYLQQRRLIKAHQLIQGNTYNALHHIVVAVGLKNFNHFKRLYQAVYGSNPITVFEQLWAIRLKQTILQHLSDYKYSVEFLLHDMQLDRKVFYQRTKRVTGLSPGRYIRQLRLEKAKTLLTANADNSMNSIAKSVGFQRGDYFTKLYQQHFSPQQLSA